VTHGSTLSVSRRTPFHAVKYENVGWAQKVTLAQRPFSDLLCVPIWFLIISDSSTRTLWQSIPAEVSNIEAGETWQRNDLRIFFRMYFLLTHSFLQDSVKRRGANGFTSPPKVVVLWIFIALKNPLCRPRYPRGLRRRSAPAWLLGSRVRIPLRAWMFVSCVYMLCCSV
jgi:hypothetical protein